MLFACAVSTWSSYSTSAFVSTEVLALLSFCAYFLFAIVLVVLQSAISDQLGIGESAGF